MKAFLFSFLILLVPSFLSASNTFSEPFNTCINTDDCDSSPKSDNNKNKTQSQKDKFAQINNVNLLFEQNIGQLDEYVLFRAKDVQSTHFFMNNEVRTVVAGKPNVKGANKDVNDYAYALEFVGGHTRDVAPLRGVGKTNCNSGQRNYITQDGTFSDVPQFEQLLYRDVWKGINAKFYESEGQLKYDFLVAAGQDPSQVKMLLKGGKNLNINTAGELEFTTALGTLQKGVPYTYQNINGKKVTVAAEYQINGDTISFALGKYDASKTLIIDPIALKYATFLGGTNDEEPYDIYVTDTYIYLTGETSSSDFPTTTGVGFVGGSDVFVTCMEKDGSAIVWSTLIGGTGGDTGYGIIVSDTDDNVYVTGYAGSSDFPVNGTLANAYEDNSTGATFLIRLSADGTQLRYGTYYDGRASNYRKMVLNGDVAYFINGNYSASGGKSDEVIGINTSVSGSAGLTMIAALPAGGESAYFTELEQDQDGSFWVVGKADYEATFPTTANAVQSFDASHTNSYDKNFVAKFSSSGAILYTSYIFPLYELNGGANSQQVPSIDLDAQGNVYVGAGHFFNDSYFNLIVAPQVQQFNELSPLSSMDYFGSTELMVIAKIPYDLSPVYDFVSILPAQTANNFSDPEIAIDKKGKIHIYNQASNGYGESFYFPYTSGAISTFNKRQDSNSGSNYYVIDPTGVSVLYGTTVAEAFSYTYHGFFVDDDCTAYMLSRAQEADGYPITPTYRDENTGSQVTVAQSTYSGDNEVHLAVFHDVLPQDNIISDFQAGNNTFCVGSLIYQNPNDGPILGEELVWESGDGSASTHNLPNINWGNEVRSHPIPSGIRYQWQISRNGGTDWDNLSGENLPVLKPPTESQAGTVQYRRTVNSFCCDTLTSNVATATIAGSFNLNIDAPNEPVYYCEGTSRPIDMTISGAAGNISWQWYNGFSPATAAEVTPASGSGDQSTFTANVSAGQTEEGQLRLVVTDSGGCKREASITILQLSVSAGGDGSLALCPGDTGTSVTLGPNAANPLLDYSWTGPSGFTSTEVNPETTVEGTYSLQVKLKTDASFCVAGQTTVNVTTSTPFATDLGNIPDSEFCQSSDPATIGLNGTGPAGYVFQWSPGINIDNQTAYNPTFDPGNLPFNETPIAEVEYTFTALRLSDGCIFETTTMVSDTALALANAGSDRALCGSNQSVLGRVETTGLHFQWEAVSTTYPAGLTALVSDANFTIDGVQGNNGAMKFATVTVPEAMTDCYDTYFVLRASYVPFPTNCFSTDTIRLTACPPNVCNPCPEVIANLEGTDGVCGGNTTLLTANVDDNLTLEWTTYSVDGVVQAAGTAPQGLFTNNNGTQGTAIAATGPHPKELIVNFDDTAWGWTAANVVVYQVRSSGFIGGREADCSLLIQVFSGQNSVPAIGVLDQTLCDITSGTPVGTPNSAPYTISGIDYTQAPNSDFNWTWEEVGGGNTTITSGANSRFPTLAPTNTINYAVMAQDPVTGCVVRDTMTMEINTVVANAGNDITGVCDGSLLQLGSSSMENADYDFQWSPTSGLNSPISTPNSMVARPYLEVSNAPSGITYSVTVTDPTSGCVASDEIIITTNTDPPTAISNQSDVACTGGGSEFANFGSFERGAVYDISVVSGGGSLSWFTSPISGGTSFRIYLEVPANTAVGTYVFQITKTKGTCGSVTANYTITVEAPPTLTLAASPPACTTPYTAITASPLIRWDFASRQNLYTTADGTTNLAFSYYETVYVEPSDKERILTGSNSASCSSSITIPASTPDVVNAGSDQNYCVEDTPIQLGVTSSAITHTWTAVGYSSDLTNVPSTPTAPEAAAMLNYLSSTTANTPTFSQVVPAMGIFVYELTSDFSSGCTGSSLVIVTALGVIEELTGPSQQICLGEPITLGVSAPPIGYSYEWSAINPAAGSIPIVNSSTVNPTVQPLVTTNYQLIVSNLGTGCQSTQTVTIGTTDKPNIADADIPTQCTPINAVDLTAEIPSYGTYFNQVWYQNSALGTIMNTPTSVTPDVTTEYFLVAENEFACTDTAMVTVNVDSPQTPNIAPSAVTVCPQNTLDLATYQGVPSQAGYTFEWHTDNTTNAGSLITNTEVGAGTYYLFELTANNCASASDNLIYTTIVPTITQSAQSVCNDNDTRTVPEDDYFTIDINATAAVANSTQYEVVLNAAQDGTGGTVLGISDYGTPITVGTPTTFVADGTTTYIVTVRDATSSGCFQNFTTAAVISCSDVEVDYPDYMHPEQSCPIVPCHEISTDIYLGDSVSGDSAPFGNSDASSDIDDGALINPRMQFVAGNTARIPVIVYNNTGNTAYLRMWIDWNGDGDFEDINEQVEDTTRPSLGIEDIVLTEITVPVSVVQSQSIAVRIRLSTDDANSAGPCGTGTCATDGEIEDYMIRVECPSNPCMSVQLNTRKGSN